MSELINEMPDFEKMADEVMNGLAKDVAKHALSFFVDSFNKQGFTDVNFIPWVKRLDTEKDMGNPLLDYTGTLKDSLHISQQTPERIEIQTEPSIPYAEIHNTGGVIEVTVTEKMKKYFWAAHLKTGIEKFKYMALMKTGKMLKIKIPQRQFIGNSYTLNEQLDKMIIERMKNSVKNIKPL